MSHFEIVIDLDEDHVYHLLSDAGRFPDDFGVREELHNLEAGIWHAYGVTVARVDDEGNIVEPYVAALWGCVVETANQEGRYTASELGRIEDEYLRTVAREVLDEAELGEGKR